MERQQASTSSDTADLEIPVQVEAGTRRMLNYDLAVGLAGGQAYVCLKAPEHIVWISPLFGSHFTFPSSKWCWSRIASGSASVIHNTRSLKTG